MTQSRKKEQLEICLTEDVSSEHNYWNDVRLIHKALPEIDFEEIDTSTIIFGKELSAPIIISGMTGGYKEAEEINKNLAQAASEIGIGMGVGSQRQAIEDSSLESTYSVVRDYEVPLMIGNLGAPQFVSQRGKNPFTLEDAKKAMEMVDADLLAIHLNFLQEVVQPEGDTMARGCLAAIKRIATYLPVIVKETGAGISRGTALALRTSKIRGIDVGGLGGTSWSAVETFRARKEKDDRKERLGRTFWNWGVPTPVSLLEANVGLPMIATGGIRNGLDVTKAMVLGASGTGIASKLLPFAKKSSEAVVEELNLIISELKAAMFLTGSKTIAQLGEANAVIVGETAEWISGLEM
ncbi:MAG: type 2 isopentenyl-diphosphate Delta-isomerase [Thermoplasmata archaeon]